MCSVLRNHSPVQATSPIPTHFSIAWSVCLSVVCHIRACCLNLATDLDAIWRYTCGVQWHIVLDGSPWPPGWRWDSGSNPHPKHAIAAATWWTETRSVVENGLARVILPFAELLWSLLINVVSLVRWIIWQRMIIADVKTDRQTKHHHHHHHHNHNHHHRHYHLYNDVCRQTRQIRVTGEEIRLLPITTSQQTSLHQHPLSVA